jgi:hypothetical protein
MATQPCFMCEAVTAQWVLWANWRWDTVRFFCDNDCLRRWLERCRDDVYWDVVRERQGAKEEAP